MNQTKLGTQLDSLSWQAQLNVKDLFYPGSNIWLIWNAFFSLIWVHSARLRFQDCSRRAKTWKAPQMKGAEPWRELCTFITYPRPPRLIQTSVPLKGVCLCAGPNKDVWKSPHDCGVHVHPSHPTPKEWCLTFAWKANQNSLSFKKKIFFCFKLYRGWPSAAEDICSD